MLPYLVVPLISARIPIISTWVSAHCQAILFCSSINSIHMTRKYVVGMMYTYAVHCWHLHGGITTVYLWIPSTEACKTAPWWPLPVLLVRLSFWTNRRFASEIWHLNAYVTSPYWKAPVLTFCVLASPPKQTTFAVPPKRTGNATWGAISHAMVYEWYNVSNLYL